MNVVPSVPSIFAVADIRRVQDFILETDRLVQMRGASRVFWTVCRMTSIVTAECGGQTTSDRGGHFVARLNDPEGAERWGLLVRAAFVRATGLPGERLVVGTGATEAEAFRAAAERKRVPAFDEVVGAPLARPCDQCGRRPAAMYLEAPGGVRLRSCKVCEKRTLAGREALKDLWDEIGLAPDGLGANLTQFAERSRPRGYLATLVADGNSIGEHLLRQAANPDEGAAFREALTRAVKDAVKVAAHEVDSRTPRGLLPLWVGGDDVVFVVHPQNALLAAEVFVREFAVLLKDFGVTMSAGVVVAHADHPFTELHALGESLLQETKASVRADWGHGLVAGGIDIEVVKESVVVSLRDRRETEGRRHLRPMAVPRPNQQLPDSFTDMTLSHAIETVGKLLEMEAPRSAIRALSGVKRPENLPASVHLVLGEAEVSNRLETVRELFELRRAGWKERR